MKNSETSHGVHALDLSRSEVRRRSLTGVLYLIFSGVAGLAISFFSSLVLARLLTPTDFGVVAVGSTVALIGGVVADGGLGAGMVRRPEAPTRSELETFNGIQLAIALALYLPLLLIAPSFGLTGQVTALMVAALPITVLGAPGRLMLTREMRYDRQVAIDLGATTSSQLFSVVAVVLGAGVWGLAAGWVVRALAMTTFTAILSSVGFVRPSIRGWRGFGTLMRFGLKFQATWAANVGREQGLNVVIAAFGGVQLLGFWTLATRLLQLPILAFNSLYTVGYPAMANLIARGEDPRPIILRTVRRAFIAGTLVFPAFAASSLALIPALFGSQWHETAEVLPWICFSTLLIGSINVGAVSYLQASGSPGIVAVAVAALGATWIAGTAILLLTTSLGVNAIGVAGLLATPVEVFITVRATHRSAGVSPLRPVLRPLVPTVFAGGIGIFVSSGGPPGILRGLFAGALTLALSLIGLWLTCPADLRDVIRLAAASVREAIPRPTKEAPEET